MRARVHPNTITTLGFAEFAMNTVVTDQYLEYIEERARHGVGTISTGMGTGMELIVIAAVIFSWLFAFNVVNPRNQFVGMIGNALNTCWDNYSGAEESNRATWRPS